MGNITAQSSYQGEKNRKDQLLAFPINTVIITTENNLAILLSIMVEKDNYNCFK